MPMLFYGSIDPARKRRRLYGLRLQPLEGSVFDAFKIDDLAPYLDSHVPNVANLWHFERRNHTALSWHNGLMVEQTVFMPGIHERIDAIAIARTEFNEVMPGPLLFRINNEGGAYSYD